MKKPKIDSITVRLPSKMKAALEKAAATQDLTVSQLTRKYFTALLSSRKPAARAAKKKEAA